MCRTYGVDIWDEFDPEKHPLEKRVVSREKVYCRDIFETLAKKGERIDIDEKRTYNFRPINPNATALSFEFYSTDEDDADFISDPGVVSENVEISIASPNTAKGCGRKLRLEVKFGGT